MKKLFCFLFFFLNKSSWSPDIQNVYYKLWPASSSISFNDTRHDLHDDIFIGHEVCDSIIHSSVQKSLLSSYCMVVYGKALVPLAFLYSTENVFSLR